MKQVFLFDCKCGATALPGEAGGWRHLTQPTIHTCPSCLAAEWFSMNTQFDEDYFLRGKETGKSLYENYRWLPELTVPMTWAMVNYLGIKANQTVLDFGCARGYLVRAFREIGFMAYGIDTSKWAIDNCDPSVTGYVTDNPILELSSVDWIIAKDVLEHVPEIAKTIRQLMDAARVGVFIVVPLGSSDGYVVPEYDKDVTHKHRWSLSTWTTAFMRYGWEVTASYRVKGIKDNYKGWPTGNGFITARRVIE